MMLILKGFLAALFLLIAVLLVNTVRKSSCVRRLFWFF